jgi:hypothetical protein
MIPQEGVELVPLSAQWLQTISEGLKMVEWALVMLKMTSLGHMKSSKHYLLLSKDQSSLKIIRTICKIIFLIRF